MVRIALDDADKAAILAELSEMPQKMRPAEEAAVRKTMTAARARLSRGVTDVANLKSSEVKKRITIKRKPTRQVPSGEIQISGSRIPLWLFNRSKAEAFQFQSQKGIPVAKRKPKTGAGWKIYKSEGKRRHKGFFIAANTKDRQFEIMRRLPGAKGGKNAVPGKDYRTAFGLSVAVIAERKQTVEPALRDIKAVLEKNLRSQVDRFLKRSKNARK